MMQPRQRINQAAHLTAGNVFLMFSGLKAGAQPLRTAAHMALSRVVKKDGMEVGL